MSLTRREDIDLYKTVQEYFPQYLIKDLTENERICPVCHGLGVKIVNNVYGLRNEGDTNPVRFPYKHQALSFCGNCFNGVQQLCPYCGKPYENQGYWHCDCEGQVKADKEKEDERWRKIIADAKQVEEKDVKTLLYCEETDDYYESVDEFIDDYEADYEDDIDRPERLWVTVMEKLHIDADDIIENACEDSYEDAVDFCDKKSLQNLLDEWCRKQHAINTTYYPDYHEYVLIDWGENDG